MKQPPQSCGLASLQPLAIFLHRLVWLLETLRKSKKRQNSLNSKFGSVYELRCTNCTYVCNRVIHNLIGGVRFGTREEPCNSKRTAYALQRERISSKM